MSSCSDGISGRFVTPAARDGVMDGTGSWVAFDAIGIFFLSRCKWWFRFSFFQPCLVYDVLTGYRVQGRYEGKNSLPGYAHRLLGEFFELEDATDIILKS
jgi:membrane protein implicated in regulation of membrane protease activity